MPQAYWWVWGILAAIFETVYGAIHTGNPTNDLIAIRYLDALQGIADGKATKIFLPLETSGVLGSIAGIGELLKDKLGRVGGGDGKKRRGVSAPVGPEGST